MANQVRGRWIVPFSEELFGKSQVKTWFLKLKAPEKSMCYFTALLWAMLLWQERESTFFATNTEPPPLIFLCKETHKHSCLGHSTWHLSSDPSDILFVAHSSASSFILNDSLLPQHTAQLSVLSSSVFSGTWLKPLLSSCRETLEARWPAATSPATGSLLEWPAGVMDADEWVSQGFILVWRPSGSGYRCTCHSDQIRNSTTTMDSPDAARSQKSVLYKDSSHVKATYTYTCSCHSIELQVMGAVCNTVPSSGPGSEQILDCGSQTFC